MNAAVPLRTDLPAIGAPMPGGIVVGHMPAADGHPAYVLIKPTHPAAVIDEALAWGRRGNEVSGLSEWDGLHNTKLLAALGEHPAAARCASIEVDGFSDYYLPTEQESAVIQKQAPHLMPEGVHWTSSQFYAFDAYLRNYHDGAQLRSHGSKEFPWRVCAVRRHIIN